MRSNNVKGRKEGKMGGCVLQRINGWMKWVYKKGGRGWWRNDEAGREMGCTSLKPPCCCWREISLFYFHPCLFAVLLLPLSPWLLYFCILPQCLYCLCTVGALPLLSLLLSSLPLTVSPSCSPSPAINYLSYEVPYLSYIALVDLPS